MENAMTEHLKNDLIKEIQKKNVIFICGTGVSLAATKGKAEMGWGGLLLNGLSLAKDDYGSITSEQFKMYINMLKSDKIDDWIYVAEVVERSLGGCSSGDFRRWLEDNFGPDAFEIKDFDILNALERLAEHGCLLATTNYDGLLEEITKYDSVTYLNNLDDSIDIIKGESTGILHLHGYWKEPESVVLGLRGYEKIKDDKRAKLIRELLRTVKTIIFVGSGGGLDDPNISCFLKWAANTFAESKSRIYAIVRQEEAKKIRSEFPPAEYHTFPVSYGENYEDLGPFLHSLLPDTISKTSATVKAETSFNMGLIAIHMSIADEGIFEKLNEAHSIDIMANTAYDLTKRYSDKIINAMAIHKCRVRILISNPKNTYWEDKAVCNGLCPGINITTEIDGVLNMLKSNVNETKQNEHLQLGGSLEVKKYSNVPTCSIIIVDNKIARFTPYLPYAHSPQVPKYDVINEGRSELFTQLQNTFERVWKSINSETILRSDFT